MSEDPRYVVSLQTVDDRSCYKDFFETNKLEEAKREADEAAERSQRSTLVFDRKFGTVYKKEIIRPNDTVAKPVANPQPTRIIKKAAPVEELEVEAPVKRGRGRPPKNKVPEKVKKQQISDDDYF
jgi:hypothetical protein